MKKHWAAKYIGRAWDKGGCWLLLQDVFRERHGVDMPDVKLGDFGDAENVAALKQAAARSGWRRVKGDPQAEDILQMIDLDGSRHVGYVIETSQGLRFLHAHGHMTAHGPVGSVVIQPLKDLPTLGFTDMECWRKAGP
jgi:hypothetical protein